MDQNELSQWYRAVAGSATTASTHHHPLLDSPVTPQHSSLVSRGDSNASGLGGFPHRLRSDGLTSPPGGLPGQHSAFLAGLHMSAATGSGYMARGNEHHHDLMNASPYAPFLWPRSMVPHPDYLLPTSPISSHRPPGFLSDTFHQAPFLAHHRPFPFVFPGESPSTEMMHKSAISSSTSHISSNKRLAPISSISVTKQQLPSPTKTISCNNNIKHDHMSTEVSTKQDNSDQITTTFSEDKSNDADNNNLSDPINKQAFLSYSCDQKLNLHNNTARDPLVTTNVSNKQSLVNTVQPPILDGKTRKHFAHPILGVTDKVLAKSDDNSKFNAIGLNSTESLITEINPSFESADRYKSHSSSVESVTIHRSDGSVGGGNGREIIDEDKKNQHTSDGDSADAEKTSVILDISNNTNRTVATAVQKPAKQQQQLHDVGSCCVSSKGGNIDKSAVQSATTSNTSASAAAIAEINQCSLVQVTRNANHCKQLTTAIHSHNNNSSHTSICGQVNNATNNKDQSNVENQIRERINVNLNSKKILVDNGVSITSICDEDTNGVSILNCENHDSGTRDRNDVKFDCANIVVSKKEIDTLVQNCGSNDDGKNQSDTTNVKTCIKNNNLQFDSTTHGETCDIKYTSLQIDNINNVKICRQNNKVNVANIKTCIKHNSSELDSSDAAKICTENNNIKLKSVDNLQHCIKRNNNLQLDSDIKSLQIYTNTGSTKYIKNDSSQASANYSNIINSPSEKDVGGNDNISDNKNDVRTSNGSTINNNKVINTDLIGVNDYSHGAGGSVGVNDGLGGNNGIDVNVDDINHTNKLQVDTNIYTKQQYDTDDTDIDVGVEELTGLDITAENLDNNTVRVKQNIPDSTAVCMYNKNQSKTVASIEKKVNATTYMPAVGSALEQEETQDVGVSNENAIDLRTTTPANQQPSPSPNTKSDRHESPSSAAAAAVVHNKMSRTPSRKKQSKSTSSLFQEDSSTVDNNINKLNNRNLSVQKSCEFSSISNRNEGVRGFNSGISDLLQTPQSPSYMSFDPRILSFYTDEEREKLVQGGWIPSYYAASLSALSSLNSSVAAAAASASLYGGYTENNSSSNYTSLLDTSGSSTGSNGKSGGTDLTLSAGGKTTHSDKNTQNVENDSKQSQAAGKRDPSSTSHDKRKNVTEKSSTLSSSSSTSTIPVGIAIARKRHDEREAERSSDQTPTGGRTDNSTVPDRVTPTVTTSTSRGLTSNLVVTGGNHGNSGYWLGHGAYSLPTSTRDGAQLQYNPPPGYKIAGDPITGQLYVIPDMTRGYGPTSPQLPSPSRASTSSIKSDQSLESVSRNTPLEYRSAHHHGITGVSLSPHSSSVTTSAATYPLLSSPLSHHYPHLTNPSLHHPHQRSISTHLQHSSSLAANIAVTDEGTHNRTATSPESANRNTLSSGGHRSRSSSRSHESSRSNQSTPAPVTTASSAVSSVTHAINSCIGEMLSPERMHGVNQQAMPPPGLSAAAFNPFTYPYYPYYWSQHASHFPAVTTTPPPSSTEGGVGDVLSLLSTSSTCGSSRPKNSSAPIGTVGKSTVSVNTSHSEVSNLATSPSQNKATVSVQTVSNPVIEIGVQTCNNLVESSVQTDDNYNSRPEPVVYSSKIAEHNNVRSLNDNLDGNKQSEMLKDNEADDKDDVFDMVNQSVPKTGNKSTVQKEDNMFNRCTICSCSCHMGDNRNIVVEKRDYDDLSVDIGNNKSTSEKSTVGDDDDEEDDEDDENEKMDKIQKSDIASPDSHGVNMSGSSIDDPTSPQQQQKPFSSPVQDDSNSDGLRILSALASHLDFFTPLTIATDDRHSNSLLSPHSSTLSHSPDGGAYNGPRLPYYNSEDVQSRYRYSYQRDRVKTPSSDDGNNTFFKSGLDTINPMEMEVRTKLAEIQRLYKVKQKQLCKLRPKKDLESSQQRRSVGSKGSRRSSKSLSDCDPLSPKPESIVSPKPPMRKTKAQLKYMPTPPPTMDPVPVENKDSDVEELRSLFEDTFLENTKDKSTERRLSFSSKVVDFSAGMSEQKEITTHSTSLKPVLNKQTSHSKVLSATRRLDKQLETSLLQIKPQHSKSERRKRKSSQGKSDESPAKKRKPGRPKKFGAGVTQTLVSKSAKQNTVFSFEDKSSSDSDINMMKEERDYWNRRRSERIFLSDSVSPVKSLDRKKEEKSQTLNKKEKVKKERTHLNDISHKLKKKYRSMDSTRQIKQQVISRIDGLAVESDAMSNSDDIPLSDMKQNLTGQMQQQQLHQSKSDGKRCEIKASDLKDGLFILYFMDGLFYEGRLREIHPPDVYGVTINGERGNRPHILSREEVLQDVILDIRVHDSHEIPIGTRICAYWSQQFTCMYPGFVVEGIPLPKTARGRGLVNVEFDDGDTGKISVEHVRVLPQDFPIQDDSDDEEELVPTKRRKSMSQELLADGWRERRPAMLDPVSNFHKPRSTPTKSSSPTSSGSQTPSKSKTINSPEAEKKTKSTKDSDSSSSESDDNEDNVKEKKKKTLVKKERTISTSSTTSQKSKQNKDQVNVLPAHQIWEWLGSSSKRPGAKGKAKKTFFKAIQRDKETIKVGECAVFLTVGRPHLPYIGRVECFYESRGGNMVVKVKWFYHPEETKGGKKLAEIRGALYESPHSDENDVQTISHKCHVMSHTRYKSYRKDRTTTEMSNVYYLAGYYDPTISLIKFEGDVKLV